MESVVKPRRSGRTRRALRARRASVLILATGVALLLGATPEPSAAQTGPGVDVSAGERSGEPAATQRVAGAAFPAVGEADYDWALETVDGQAVSLSDYRGEVLVINMWATWCAPCVAELRSFQSLVTSMEGSGVRFLFVSPEDPDRVHQFLRQYGYRDLPALVEGRPMPDAFGLEALPTTWIVDRQGRIVLKHRGAADWDSDAVRALLRQLSGPTLAGG